MGKALGLVAALTVVVTGLVPARMQTTAHAESGIIPCSGTSSPSPMQGHYTGPWHSDGDYHFLTMGYDVNLKIIIDGTLDLTVTSDGHVTGTASGKVDAPIYDFGQKDVSSGYGTISGSVVGIMQPAGSDLVLSHPVISMHWGTFVAGGYTVDRAITMPDYHLAATAVDCISGGGTIAEKDFPVQTVIADGAGQMSQAPGVGSATGTWQITSDRAGTFSDLSRQVDSFISSATAMLAGPPLRPAQLETQILAPLRALVASIKAEPDVSRCLMERLGAWERSAATSLYARAASANGVDLAGYRAESDLLQSASLLGADCAISDGGASDRLLSTELGDVRSALGSRTWGQAALVAREIVLWRGGSAQPQLQGAIDSALHARLQAVSDSRSLLEVARIAYVLGDGADSAAAVTRLTATHSLVTHKSKKKRKKPRATPTPKPTIRPTARPTSTTTPKPGPTSTPGPRTLEQVLASGITRMDAHAGTDTGVSFSWQPVAGAVHYLVAVYGADGSLAWTWWGAQRSVAYGETGIDGVPDTSGDPWPIPLPSGYTWTVTALDGSGTIIGLKVR